MGRSTEGSSQSPSESTPYLPGTEQHNNSNVKPMGMWVSSESLVTRNNTQISNSQPSIEISSPRASQTSELVSGQGLDSYPSMVSKITPL